MACDRESMSVATRASRNDVVTLGIDAIDRLVELEKRSQSHPWPRQAFAEAFHQPYSRVIGVRRSQKIVAFCNYWLVENEMQILNLVVDPLRRRMGVASTLVAHVVGDAERCGTAIHLEGRCSNHGAIALYQRYRFVPVAVRQSYYPDNGEDAQVMRRDIDTDISSSC